MALAPGGRRLELSGERADDVWNRLRDSVGQIGPKYVGFAGARNRFLDFFANGFHSDGYAEEERDYKVAAKERLDREAPVVDVASHGAPGEAMLRVYRDTNLLSPYEKIRVQNLLRGPSADRFIRAAAVFTLDPTKRALLDLEQATSRHEAAKWTIITYLPFLWRPHEHMFLKPEVTKDFAARVGHRFATGYEARLNFEVYRLLLDLVEATESELIDLRPRDRIDIQSFIWVVGDYKEDTEPPKA